MRYSLIPVLALSILLFGTVFSSALAQSSTNGSLEPSKPMDKKIEDTANEVTKAVIERIKTILDEKLDEIREGSRQFRIPLTNRIKEKQSLIQKDPRDATAYFELGKLFDQNQDGANTIINIQKAVKLFAEQNNIKGVAESRRLLRQSFQKYGFKPEDFKVESQ
jgi:Zn-finger domain-containing protein